MKQEQGRKALELYAEENSYLFHGSQIENISELEPRITDSKAERQKDIIWVQEVPVVSATADVDVAIFAATVWRRGIGTSGWHSTGQGSVAYFTFNASKGVIEEVIKSGSYGYVYVLPKSTFEPTAEIPAEFQSAVPVRPVAVVRVHANDLRPDVRSLQPDTRLH